MFKYVDLQSGSREKDGLSVTHRHFAYLYYDRKMGRSGIMQEMKISRRSYYRYRQRVSKAIRENYQKEWH